MGLEFQGWLKSRNIHYEITNTDMSQKNRIVKWFNRTILEMTRTMLFESKLLKSF